MNQLVVATANVLRSLSRDEARESLHDVLASAPDLVGLQEWGLARRTLLREAGSVRGLPLWPGAGRRRGSAEPGYLWYAAPAGGCVVGARADRFRLVRSGSALLDGVGRAERPDRWLGIEPPRFAAVSTYEERASRRRVALVSYHLVSGVQVQGAYRADWPRLVRRHRHEVGRLQDLCDQLGDRGYEVHAVGDSNFDGLHLSGLTSAWEGRGHPGTLGHRCVDDVFGPGQAASVKLIDTESDHKALVVTR